MKKYLKIILFSIIFFVPSFDLMACISGFSSSTSNIICLTGTGGSFNSVNLSISIQSLFTGSTASVNLQWQVKRNNGSWQTFLHEDVDNPPSFIARTHTPNQVGIFQYKVIATCTQNNPFTIESDETTPLTRTVGNRALNANCDLLFDLSRAVAKITVPGISSSFSGFLINNSLNDGRLLFMTSAKPFACSSYNLNNATFSWNEQQNDCNALTQVSSTGATLLATDGYIALLELDGPLPLEEYILLGWNKNTPSSVVSIFQSSNSNVKKGMAKGGSISTFWQYYDLACDGTFNNDWGTGNPAVKINFWGEGGGLDEYSRGAPLISGNRAVGVYLSSHNISECTHGPSLGTLLNNTSNFDQYLSPDGATSASSILFEPCKDEEFVEQLVVTPLLKKANIRVTGSSKLNNIEVIFQAGEEVILEDGFDSGNNFIAEIVPCIPDFAVINPKPEPEDYTTEHFKNSEPESFSNLRSNTIDVKVYPTVEVEDRITIEVSGLTELDYTIVNLEGKVLNKSKLLNANQNFSEIIALPNMAAGVYFLVLRNNSYSETIKLIKK